MTCKECGKEQSWPNLPRQTEEKDQDLSSTRSLDRGVAHDFQNMQQACY